jgi:hypothetical protein
MRVRLATFNRRLAPETGQLKHIPALDNHASHFNPYAVNP